MVQKIPNVEIKYKDKNGKSHLQKTDLEHVYEHILNDGNKSLISLKMAKDSCLSSTIYDLWR